MDEEEERARRVLSVRDIREVVEGGARLATPERAVLCEQVPADARLQ